QLGDGTTDRSYVPKQIGGADDWSAVTAGDYGGRALRHDGSMRAWGYDDGGAGRFGDGSAAYTQYYSPKMIFTGVPAVGRQPVDVIAGYNHALMLKGDGTLWGWGANQYGQAGGTGTRLSPAPVDAGREWADVSAGLNFTLGLKADGTLWSWGYNNQGQLGHGDQTARSTPAQVGTGADWISVAAGSYSGFALKADGTLWSWGLNTEGQLGHGDYVTWRFTPTQVGTDTDWAEILDAGSHAFALKADGTLWAWGDNFLGRLGLGDEVNRNAPEQVGSFDDWVAASAAGHSLGVRADGTLWAWGRGNNSQLGLGDTENRSVPTQVAGTGWADVAAGSLYSLARKADGTMWAWGANDHGQLGLGDTTSRNTPTRVGSSSGWTGVSTKSFSSYAIDAAGLVYSWGRNDTGQLGLGDTNSRNIPTFTSAAGDVTEPLLLGVRSATHPVPGVAYPLDDFTASVDMYDTGSHIVGYSWVIDQLTDTVPDEIVDTFGVDTLIVAENLAVGTWYLHVRAVDGGANASAVFTRAIMVSEPVVVNAPPVAVVDSYSTAEDTPLSIAAPGVLGNDTDAEDDALTAVKLTDPAHGDLTLSSTGSFAYTPDADYNGTDSFTYKANDTAADSNVATVTITVTPVEDLPPIIKIEGDNRFETAVAASLEAYPDGLDDAGARTVVIATGRNWPDALGGSSLAGALDGPILLVDTNSVPAEVSAEIARLKADKAIILGGTAAVGTPVETALKLQLGTADVTRIAGAGRYETADKIAAKVIELAGASFDGTAFVATGAKFPDALGAAPLAAANAWPLYLANPTTGLSSATKSAMDGVDTVLVLGGTAVVSPAAETYLNTTYGDANVTRLAGADRYETAVKVATWGVDHAGLGWNRVAIATGTNFPDALAGGVLQGRVGSVMLLTKSDALNTYTSAALSTHKADIATVTFFGGLGALPQVVRDQVSGALE
ncbi:MAG: cell wall-binding repeat-containing protein, partial [Actinomycetota bacterium]|nr:cell wall-binding repeat-containing protein [Actinomycetota bacterium]